MKGHSSLAKKAIAAAVSAGSASRFMGEVAATAAFKPGVTFSAAFNIPVSVAPGITLLQRIASPCLAHHVATDLVKACTPALLAE